MAVAHAQPRARGSPAACQLTPRLCTRGWLASCAGPLAWPIVDRRHAEGEEGSGVDAGEGEGEEEEEQAFSPERGNVAFGSAYDGWAFRIDQFAGGLPASVMPRAAMCLQPAGLWDAGG